MQQQDYAYTYTNNVWPIWCGTTATASNTLPYYDTGATTNNLIWSQWNYQGTMALQDAQQWYPGSTNAIWQTWININAAGTNGIVYTQTLDEVDAYAQAMWAQWSELSEAQRAERQAELKRLQDRRQAEREALEADMRRITWERAEAAERARQLIEELLTDEQIATYSKEKVIYVTSQSGKKYRIKGGGVHLLDEKGQAIANFCIQPTIEVPEADAHATKLLLLKFAEEEFERVARRTDLSGYVRPERRV